MSEPAAASSPREGHASMDGWPAWRRVALGGGGGMFVGMGLGRFSYTAMVPALISSGQLNVLEAGRIGAINIAGFALGALISVPMSVRVGAFRLLTVVAILSVLALAASAVPLGFAWLGFWRGLVGLTAGIIMVLSLALIASTAPSARRPVAASFVFAGVGLAIFMTGILVPRLLERGLATAWLGLAACGFAAMMLAIWGWRGAPAASTPAPARLGAATPWTWPLRFLLAGYFFFSIAIVPHTLYWVDYLARGLGLGMAEGGLHWSIVGIASALGPWSMAALGLLLGTAWALPLSFITLGLGIGAPLLSGASGVLFLSSVLFGAQPGLSALMAARVRDLADAQHMPRLMRAMILSSAGGAVVAGAVLPQIYELTQSHVLIFAIGGGAMMLGGLLVAPWGGVRR
ncbi:MAG: YbfB/YjiJ family MFS transporter [Hyphomicrobium sp.]|nr:YbfB/YjiJ family MFS transporter [Hyphomicrobium sp.]